MRRPAAEAAGKPSKLRVLALNRGNLRAYGRRAAVQELNALVMFMELDLPSMNKRSVQERLLDRTLRLLNKTCTSEPERSKFARAVHKWVSNGGQLPEGLRQIDGSSGVHNVLVDAGSTDAAAQSCAESPLPQHTVLEASFVLQSKAFMLTHNSRSFTADTWGEYREWAQQLFADLKAKAWAACLEESCGTTASASVILKVFHGHVYLFWDAAAAGVHMENLDRLAFQGVKPRVDKCMAGTNNRSPRKSALHGLWYVSVMKKGTFASDSNLAPWRDYKPLVPWLVGLWADHKLTDDQFAAFSLEFRVGHSSRRRDVSDVSRDTKHAVVAKHVAKELAELEDSGNKMDFKSFDLVNRFVALFQQAAWRRPMLIIVGGSNLGKSMLAAHVLAKVGEVVKAPSFLEVTVEADDVLDLSAFDLIKHSGVLFDGVGDVLTLKKQRESLQGRPKICHGGKSATMMYAYPFTLSRRAVVVTMDLSAKHLPMLKTDHWLSNDKNCMVLYLDGPSWVTTSFATVALPVSPEDAMRSWSVADLCRFLEERDLCGPANHLANQGVNGSDFYELTADELIDQVRVTPFVAKKLVSARDSFLKSND